MLTHWLGTRRVPNTLRRAGRGEERMGRTDRRCDPAGIGGEGRLGYPECAPRIGANRCHPCRDGRARAEREEYDAGNTLTAEREEYKSLPSLPGWKCGDGPLFGPVFRSGRKMGQGGKLQVRGCQIDRRGGILVGSRLWMTHLD
jgi:hypothetical protein